MSSQPSPEACSAGGSLEDYDYHLPASLIAKYPAARRDASRLLLLERKTGRIAHHAFHDLPDLLPEGTLAVLNNSRVIRARIPCPAGEIFLVERTAPASWRCLVRPGRRFRAGATGTAAGAAYTVTAVESDGCRLLDFDREPDHERFGEVPLPPYLRRQAEPSDAERYQTVYAEKDGSVAAPTAGLHFTPEILARIPHTFLTLHVGIGTFLPVKTSR
ncbi:MAG: S-adenosylmethionine:tRNA ribosyltransferase-isomerase, partial [Terrimicrobiaceae bacterium]|nr:S-adenosylmethionine:tRNA ribosyltransferase-isomerase [Terrimicrobiaceae bacterium]